MKTNEFIVAGTVGNIHRIKDNTIIVNIAQNFEDKPTEWIDVFFHSNAIPQLERVKKGDTIQVVGFIGSRTIITESKSIRVPKLIANYCNVFA